jgi:NAD(P)-dependent dehydrogenase (short-subunit alcohol dehydrogenase family)
MALGSAIARRVASGGFHVFVAGRTAEKVALVVDDLQLRGNVVNFHAAGGSPNGAAEKEARGASPAAHARRGAAIDSTPARYRASDTALDL